mgnify:CR=1 FL=1
MRFLDGIVTQPTALERSRQAVSAALAGLPRPGPDDVIALVGIGASEHAARGAAPVWRAAGVRAFPVSAAEVDAAPRGAGADFSVLISESGRSTETQRALEAMDVTRCLAVVNDPDSPLARATPHVLHLGSGEDSPVYTTGYTATLQALGMLADHWAGRTHDWSELPSLVDHVLKDARNTVEEVAESFGHACIIDVVGGGVSQATAGEGALLLRESARLLTAAHETRGYLHGPMEPLDEKVACLVVGSGREIRLAQDTAALGCRTLLITTSSEVVASGSLSVLRLPSAGSPLAQAILEILPIQRLAWAVASARGLRVDGFRHVQDDTKLP